MRTSLLAVYIHLALPIYGAEMQKHLLFTDFLIEGHRTSVPQGAIFTYRLSNARKRRLHGAGNQQLAIVMTWSRPQFTAHNGIVPKADKVLTLLTHQLRPGKLGQRVSWVGIR